MMKADEKELKPMTFKESAAADTKNIFFDIDEFADIHLINGKETLIVVDDDKMNELVESKFTPLDRVYEKMVLFYARKEALGFIPRVNSSFFFDNEMYQVADVTDDGFGVLTVTIGRNIGR